MERGERARESVLSDAPTASVHVLPLDLSSLRSVAAFPSRLDALIASDAGASVRGEDGGTRVHYLINNAGVMMIPEFRTTRDGVEMQWGINPLGHFLLTELLMPALRAAAPARIVNVASLAHEWATVEAADLPPKRETYS